MTNNPIRILGALDRHLHGPFQLHIYGRSALALGYPRAPDAYQATLDVDAILPSADLRAIETNEDFWAAQEAVNREFTDSGLYFTHLFEEKQVILTPGWRKKAVPIAGIDFRHLTLLRPSTADLVLTKMMRVDPEDRADIQFLLRQADFSKPEMQTALGAAVIPQVEEIAQAFEENRTWLLGLLGRTSA